MIKNIVLDMGNVCCRWDVDYISSKLTTNKEDQEFLIKHLFQSPQWIQLDKGSISLQEAKQQLLESVSKEKRKLIEYGFEHWFDYFEQFDEMEEFIKEYKQKGYHFYLLSNCSIQFNQYYQTKSIFQHLEGLYISAAHQKIKPNLDIFEDFLKEYHLNAKECLFVDDLKENVEAAKKVGMQGLVYQGNIHELKQMIK
ncbi:MAG: HAD family phosphatase [Bacillota bacterium]|nr:HAD family phosphatase [Bacillota bacterium]